MKMNLPNYKNGSIVNLMSSIKKAYGGNSLYKPLKDFDISSFSGKNIVLIIIDGLGYEFLLKYGKNSFLHKNLKKKITSVFPPTTATAMTSFATGVAPQQHAFTGWFMYLKEIGLVSAVLPFMSRAGEFRLKEGNIKYQEIYDVKSFFADLKVASISITHKDYANSDYSLLSKKGAKIFSFSNLNDFFRQINKAIRTGKSQRFVFAYWDKLDTFSHKEGTDSKNTIRHFKQLDEKISKIAKSLKNTNTAIIVTADHGLINGSDDKLIELKNYSELEDMLILPLAGDARLAYCYVRPSKTKEFETYVKTKFNKFCEVYKSDELIRKGFFGLYEPHKKLKNRIGDYVLIMKDNYAIRDSVPGEERHHFIGHHGGVSKEEMYVPLIVIE